MGDVIPNTEFIIEWIETIARRNQYKNHELNIVDGFEKGDNYLGDVKRATLKGTKENGEEEELKLIIKTLPPALRGNDTFPVEKVHQTEIYIYNEYLPKLLKMQNESGFGDNEKLFKVAPCYVASSVDKKEILIFKDMNPEGFITCNRFKPLDLDHLMVLTKALASFHALSFAIKKNVPSSEYKKDYDNIFILKFQDTHQDFIKGTADKLMPYMDSEDRSKLKQFLDGDFLKEHREMYDYDLEDPYKIFTHGDLWINNLLFKYEEGKPKDIIMLDWQISKYTSPVCDILYLFYLCTDEKTRDDHWDTILNTYYETFKDELIKLNCDPEECYPEAIFHQQMKKYQNIGLIISIIMMPFTLNNKEDVVDVSELIGEKEKNYFDLMKYSKSCTERFKGVVKHMIKCNAI